MSETTDYLISQATAMEKRKLTILSSHALLLNALKAAKASDAEIAIAKATLGKQLNVLNRMQQAMNACRSIETLRDAVGADHLPHFGGMVTVLAAEA
jgi:hypothetical protein